jgi:soluble lytic murein transglycosylase
METQLATLSRKAGLTIGFTLLLAVTVPILISPVQAAASERGPERKIIEANKALEQDRLATAIRLLRGVLDEDVYGPVAGIIISRSYLKLGCPEIAESYLRRLLKRDSASVYKDMILELLVDSLCAQQDTDALKIIERMVHESRRSEKPELIFKAAQLHHHVQNFDSAEKLYRKLYFEFPASLAGLRAAERLASLVVQKKIPAPNYSDSLRLKRASRLFSRGRFEKAAIMYRIYLKSNPDDLRIKLKLARSMFKARKNEECIRLCKELLQEDKAKKHRVQTLHLLSLVFWRLDQDDRFLACCKAILREGDESYKRRILYNMSAFHMERQEYSQARKLLTRLLDLGPSPGFKVDALWKLAWAKYLPGEYSSAARVFRQVKHKSRDQGLTDAARYWEARSVQKASGFDEAVSSFKRLAKDNPLGYYGIQAARILKEHGADFSAAHPLKNRFPSMDLTRAHRNEPRLRAALELMDLDLFEFALINLEALPRSMKDDPPVAFLRASAAYSAKRYHQARSILYSVFGKYMTNPPPDAPAKFIELAFPCVHKDQTLEMAGKHSVDPFLVWAIMRQESLYNSSAVSPAGAMGLMQVMPQTARKCSDKKLATCDLTALLLDPETNIEFGTSILASNLRSFDNRIVPAVASYNADIRKVRQWNQRRGRMDTDEFIETIPYQETRLYVKKVLENYEAYTYLHKRKNLAGLW